MNAGAAVATAPVLCFLHADSAPPLDSVPLIRRTLERPGTVGGAFEFRFAERGASLLLVTVFNRIRYRLTGRTVLIRAPVVTSGRRFLTRGPLRTLVFGGWPLLHDMLGFDTDRYAERWCGPEGRTPGSTAVPAEET